jgi:hypothetical protein
LFLLRDKLAEFGDSVCVPGSGTSGSESFEEGGALGLGRLSLSVPVKAASQAKALQSLIFSERDSANLGALGRAVNGVCVDWVTTNALEAELVVRQAMSSRSKVGGPWDVSCTNFPALMFRGEHGGCALAIDRLQGVNLSWREGADHLGEQIVGPLEQVSRRDRFGVGREIPLGEAWVLEFEATSGRALVVKIGAAESGPKGDIHPEGAMIAIEGLMEFEVSTTGVEETM